MRYAMIGLWFFVSLAVGAGADETVPAEELPDTEPQAVASPVSAEEEADAEIREIEAGVSGAG